MYTHFRLIFTLILAALFVSCSSEQSFEYLGKNMVYLEAEEEPVLSVANNKEIPIKLMTINRATKDIKVEVVITPLAGAEKEGIEVVEKELILKAGEREITFHIRRGSGYYPTTSISEYEVGVRTLSEEEIAVHRPLRIRLKSFSEIKLTSEQKRLLEIYKQKGMDLTSFIGIVKVETTVEVPPEGLIEGFKDPWTKKYEGVSVITLSEKSTEEQPVLKMTSNAMGAEEFFYFGLRKNTIENYEFWYGEYAAPLFKDIRELISWTDKSVETFSTSLDNIRIAEKDSEGNFTIEFLRKEKNLPVLVPFEFNYSAWSRQKVLIDKGNEKAIDCHERGASADPGRYLNTADVTFDDFSDEGGAMPPCIGKWDVKENSWEFYFFTYIECAGNHTVVRTKYMGSR